jgi:hypothetical protein
MPCKLFKCSSGGKLAKIYFINISIFAPFRMFYLYDFLFRFLSKRLITYACN